jgi:hypothetical protein
MLPYVELTAHVESCHKYPLLLLRQCLHTVFEITLYLLLQGEGSESESGHAAHSSTATDEGDDEEEEDGEEFAASKKLSSSITPQTMNSTAAPAVTPNATTTSKIDGANTRERESDSTLLLPDGATSGERRDLSGIVMDVVILGAPLCSKVSG